MFRLVQGRTRRRPVGPPYLYSTPVRDVNLPTSTHPGRTFGVLVAKDPRVRLTGTEGSKS